MESGAEDDSSGSDSASSMASVDIIKSPYKILDENTPFKELIHRKIQQGLAVTGHLEFEMDWTHEDLDNWLRKTFPTIFPVLDEQALMEHTDDSDRALPPWVLCCKRSGHKNGFEVLPLVKPTTADIRDLFNHGTRVSIADRYVAFGTSPSQSFIFKVNY